MVNIRKFHIQLIKSATLITEHLYAQKLSSEEISDTALW